MDIKRDNHRQTMFNKFERFPTNLKLNIFPDDNLSLELVVNN